MAATLTGSGVNFSDGSTINGTTANTIGSYGLLGCKDATNINWSGTRAGSGLWPAGLGSGGEYGAWTVGIVGGSFYATGQAVTLSGTWRCLGRCYGGSFNCATVIGATLWVRIS